MVSQLFSTTLVGVEAQFVRVEVDLASGLPGFHIVGLPDTAVGESVHRVRSALRSVGHPIPPRRCTINLAPGDLRKEGPRFDLAIALGLLSGNGVVAPELVADSVVLGELSLEGEVRPVRGVLNTALALRERGLRRLFLPNENLPEVDWLDGLELWPVGSLAEMLERLPSGPPLLERRARRGEPVEGGLDLGEVLGQEMGKRVLQVAAAGGHHLLWIGPPGCGKTMLSRCLPALLPELEEQQALEVLSVASAMGQARADQLSAPLAQPHCHISTPALLGSHRPGELSRAHQGVLFLDEVTEFARDGLEGLRTALETGWVEVGRVKTRVRYPARFQLVAACNPCPCGYAGDEKKVCCCSDHRRLRYLNRLSGPIRDRVDLQVMLKRPDLRESWKARDKTTTVQARAKVLRARARQAGRGCLNRDLSRSYFEEKGVIEEKALDFVFDYASQKFLSMRALEKILRVAQTVADLDGKPRIDLEQVQEAVHYRCLDQQGW
ncbi:MAG: YifB family Mg chelatase-like AAA ATPase [Candidatus Eremiobacteraeota bacterium]|nr:YifB family Mg chelatase-like AAA ATPase [Candidatus Eremiobacteraeota bacterium]